MMILNSKPLKRVLIAGSRSFNNYYEAESYIDLCLSNIKKYNQIIIISGGAAGADKIGEMYADANKMKCERYLPEWEKFGKSAGLRRNYMMVKNSDYVICFWDRKSRGTKSTIEFSKTLSKPLSRGESNLIRFRSPHFLACLALIFEIPRIPANSCCADRKNAAAETSQNLTNRKFSVKRSREVQEYCRILNDKAKCNGKFSFVRRMRFGSTRLKS